MKIHIYLIVFGILFLNNVFHCMPVIVCEDSTDCAHINGTCKDGFCHCKAGNEFSPSSSSCLPNDAFGESCAFTSQCSHMGSSAVCIDKKCHQQVPLNSTCNYDIDCAFAGDRASVACINQKCSCAKGFDHHPIHGCIRNETINNKHELSDSENKAPTNDTLHETNNVGPNYGASILAGVLIFALFGLIFLTVCYIVRHYRQPTNPKEQLKTNTTEPLPLISRNSTVEGELTNVIS
uniref:CSON002762 protein n=1 Tax=Culicoides sonorensis TaxID=179676 RepID=A0A336MK86_CULSO